MDLNDEVLQHRHIIVENCNALIIYLILPFGFAKA